MTPHEIRFAADGMLQSLATWLRLLGYDCVSRTDHDGRRLLEQAATEGRAFLTRNAHLADNLPHALLARGEIVYVVAERLPAQVREVVRRFALDPETFAFTRCIACNVPLESTAIAPAGLPADVAARETVFWQCPGCGKTFWRGSHVINSLARMRDWLR